MGGHPIHMGTQQKQRRRCCCAGDVNSISIGDKTNIQDNCLIHVAKNNPQAQPLPTTIGSNVTIGAPPWLCLLAEGGTAGLV